MSTDSEVFSGISVGGHQLASVTHHARSDDVVLFCHGFRGEKSGPNRTFVTLARALASHGISSLRFDQYGSGDSEGDFIDSRFDDWVSVIRTLTRKYLGEGKRVALFGQSMGGSAVICAAAGLDVSAVVSWVPDASTDQFAPDPRGFVEEGGQRVDNAFWTEAHRADIVGKLKEVTAPCYLVFGTSDKYVSVENREALINACQPTDQIDVFDGYPHSSWSFEQADDIIRRSAAFLARYLHPDAADPSSGPASCQAPEQGGPFAEAPEASK
ncbi:alpha/beta hydrolase family protein [Cryobacterium fucosi]|uniref:alpha/beta hydrolase family protein n=1 Tax=Cryobacterium fucosi TaxID=1259157 RepID=UPI00141B57D7|nr:alpha/beta fold hydrolase [Cryobacterium fucosi]